MNNYLTNQKYNIPDFWECNNFAKIKTHKEVQKILLTN